MSRTGIGHRPEPGGARTPQPVAHARSIAGSQPRSERPGPQHRQSAQRGKQSRSPLSVVQLVWQHSAAVSTPSPSACQANKASSAIRIAGAQSPGRSQRAQREPAARPTSPNLPSRVSADSGVPPRQASGTSAATNRAAGLRALFNALQNWITCAHLEWTTPRMGSDKVYREGPNVRSSCITLFWPGPNGRAPSVCDFFFLTVRLDPGQEQPTRHNVAPYRQLTVKSIPSAHLNPPPVRLRAARHGLTPPPVLH